MIIKCNSCEKSFTVPDNAINKNGRLVKCGLCGNKWTQYPQENEKVKIQKIEKSLIEERILPKKTVVKKKKKTKQIYTSEYLQKKHGIKIINPSDSTKNLSSSSSATKKNINSLGFYNHLLIFIVFAITILGTLNLTEEIINTNFPNIGEYIFYLFETINNLKLIIFDIFSKY